MSKQDAMGHAECVGLLNDSGDALHDLLADAGINHESTVGAVINNEALGLELAAQMMEYNADE